MLRKRLAIFFLLVLTVILIPTPLTSIPPAKAFSRVASLALNSSLVLKPGQGGPLTSAVIDPAGGYAYFGTSPGSTVPPPASIIKVRLSDFSSVANLTLNPGANDTTSAVIDPSGGYAYFGTGSYYGTGGIIARIRLSDFTLQGNLYTGADHLSSAVIDPAAGYAYFGADNLVVRIRLSDFTLQGALDANIGILVSAVIAPELGYAYFGGADPYIAKIRLSNFTLAGTLYTGAPAEDMVIDTTAGYAYFSSTNASAGYTALVVKVRLSDFTVAGILNLPGVYELKSASIDVGNGFAYFGSFYSGTVLKIALDSFSLVGVLNLYGSESPTSAVIDPAGGYVYFGTDVLSMIRIRLSDFTLAGYMNLSSGEGGLGSAVIDLTRGYIYFGAGDSPGKIVRIRLSDFTHVDTLTLNPGEDLPSAALIDPAAGYAYFGMVSGYVVKVRLSDFTRIGSLYSGFALSSALIDTAGGYAYFGTETGVVRVRLSDFTLAGKLSFSAVQGSFYTSLIDSAGGYAYFGGGSEFAPAVIVRIRLSDFTLDGTLTLNVGENFPHAAVIDPGAGYAYFGVENTNAGYPHPTAIVKVRLSNFTRVGALPLNAGPMESAVIDSEDGYAYFGTSNSPGIVVRIHLPDFTATGNLTLNTGEDFLSSGVVDPVAGYAYFGTLTDPGIVVKIQIWSSLNIPCSGKLCQVVSNSTLSNGTYVPNNLYFNSTGSSGSIAFANATVPHSLVPDVSKVEVYQNGTLIPQANVIESSNSSHYSFYLTFLQHTKDGFRICMGPCSPVDAGIPPYVPIIAIPLTAVFTLSTTRRPRSSPRLSSRTRISYILDTE